MSAPLRSVPGVPDPGHSAEPSRGELGERLLELAATYTRVTEMPEDLAALKHAYGEQGLALVKLVMRVDELEARLVRLERRSR